ncbi:MAG: MSMEG_0568 family radical SAM protein [Deltaproteobacteria bacterium]|nr:MAG: MSMEG_0568 family radical SAM protein [Deltaproteobacteria bacterium]
MKGLIRENRFATWAYEGQRENTQRKFAAEVITEIQTRGVRIEETPFARKGGAGPAEGAYLEINGMITAVPVRGPYVRRSPYTLGELDGVSYLFRETDPLLPASLVRLPRFYQQRTTDGIPYWKIALLHGKDCLATSIFQKCIFWETNRRCKFCGIELSLQNGKTIAEKSPEQIAEVAHAAHICDGIRHVVLTTGTAAPRRKEIDLLAACASAIKKDVGLPVHVQCLPLTHLEELERLKEAGVDTIGLHIETFDQEVLRHVAPAKASIEFKKYERAWQRSVELFGANQVSSFLIVGIGETDKSILMGSELLSDLGVYPFLVPLRPIPGSHMQGEVPPDPKRMKSLCQAVSEILRRKGLCAKACKAGCVRCGACSPLPAFEEEPAYLVCHPVRTRSELEAAFKIREEVFVKEQKMFVGSDRDKNDKKSTHLIVMVGDDIVGTVRVFPVGKDGHWVGGRLAVKKAFRATGAGKVLVKEAVRYVKGKGCKHFTAHIQEKNVPFFLHLGWKPLGKLEQYCGRPHQLMEANLD